MSIKTVLVSGGCGYIGSHVCCRLSEAGYRTVVVDNLSTGFADALIHGEKLYRGDCGDPELLAQIYRENKVDAVMHFAASIVVPDSVRDPVSYYRNNVVQSIEFFAAAVRHGVAHCVLSSTAAVYGLASGECDEDAPTQPLSPYGKTKLIDEGYLADLAMAYSYFRSVSLRYFNVAGADPHGRLGQSTPQATHLIKRCVGVALGHYPHLEIFGNDYPTRDGTCIRDYIHVWDLAAAHLDALRYLETSAQAPSQVLNCGYSHGTSVREVVTTVQETLGVTVTTHDAPRRAGDPACLIARSDRIRKVLGWQPEYANNLASMISSAYAWEQRLITTHRTVRRPSVAAEA